VPARRPARSPTLVPGVWDHAEKLICCELITPPGNWSSYRHKHDASEPCPVVNEEIYYYRIAGDDQVSPSCTGFGYHRSYTGPEHEAAGLSALDELIEVRDHDVVLIPHGYHGPCISAPGYPMYYLNVMPGPAAERALAFCDDPVHGWVRDTWADQQPDPRCPVTSAAGRFDTLAPSAREGTRDDHHDHSPDDGTSPRALDDRTALGAARRHRSAALPKGLRDLRTRQRARARHRAVRRAGRAADLARFHRAGHGSGSRGLRPRDRPPPGDGGHVVGWTRCLEHGHRRRCRARQPIFAGSRPTRRAWSRRSSATAPT